MGRTATSLTEPISRGTQTGVEVMPNVVAFCCCCCLSGLARWSSSCFEGALIRGVETRSNQEVSS